MKRLDLRTRLLTAVGLVALLQVVIAFAVISLTRSHLVDQIDDRLATAVSPDRGRGFDPAPPPPGSANDDNARPQPERFSDVYEGMLSASGSLTTFFAPNTTGAERAAPDVSLQQAELSLNSATNVDAVEGDFRYRMAAVQSENGNYFITAIPLDGVDATVSRLTTVVALTAAAISLALALVTWWVLRLGIAPIKRMTTTAEAIAAGDLSERITDIDDQTEAGQLGHALNAMLGRIETSFDDRARAEDKLRQFIADASHELRTPVATIRGYAELYHLGGLSDPAELDDAMRRTEQESQRMSRLIGDMLNLAKLDRDPTLATRPVAITALAQDAAADAQATHPTRTITHAIPADPLMVEGDEDLLRQVLANIVGNAIVHTDNDATVNVAVRSGEAEVIIEVADTGDGMTPDEVERTTERFYRADASRSRHKGGSGLGLAIVDSVIDAHNGKLSIESTTGVGTTVTVSLPMLAGGTD